MSSNDLAPGTQLGAYRILEVLGRGGMGVVYRGLEETTGRTVAIKVLARHLSHDEVAARRFRREGQAATVVHQNIATLFFAGEIQGTSFLVFELVSGGTLKKLIETRGPLPWREAVALALGIARALEGIHKAGLVHRDLKPDNVLLDGAGVPKVTDFGLVGKSREAELTATGGLTKSGEVMGTLQFMAPEQADGRKVDARADLYSLGATLYQMLTGTTPFQGHGFDVIRRILTEKPVAPRAHVPEIPAPVDRLVLRLLAKAPEDRGESATAIVAQLEGLLSGEKAKAGPSPVVFRLLVAAFAAMTIATVALVLDRRKPEPPKPAEPVAPLVSARPVEQPTVRPKVLPAISTGATRLTAIYGGYAWKPGWGMNALAVSRDGKRALTAGKEAVMLWDLSTGEELACLIGHTVEAMAAVFSPDGLRAASAGKDGTIRIWDLEARQEVLTIKAGTPHVFSVAWEKDLIFSGQGDGKVRVWNAGDGTAVATLAGHAAPVLALAISPDGARLASGDEKGAVKTWDVASLRSIGEQKGHAAAVYSIAWLPDSRRFLTASQDMTLALRDTGAKAPLRAWRHPHPVRSVAVSPDGKRAVTGSFDTLVRIFDLGDPSGEPAVTCRGNGMEVHAVGFPANDRALSAGLDGSLRRWDTTTGSEIDPVEPHGNYVSSVSLAPGGRFVSSGQDGKLAVWDLDRGSCLNVTETGGPVEWRFSTASKDSKVALVAVPSGLGVLDLTNFAYDVIRMPAVFCVALLPGKKALAGGTDGTLRVVDLDTRQTVRELQGRVGRVNALAVTKSGKRAVAGGNAGTFLEAWDLEKGTSRSMIPDHDKEVTAVQFLDGERGSFLSSSMDRTVRFWRASEALGGPQGVRINPEVVHRFFSCAVSPDETLAITCNEGGLLELWDTLSWKQTDVIDLNPIHDFPVSAVFIDYRQFLVGTARGVILRFERRSKRP